MKNPTLLLAASCLLVLFYSCGGNKSSDPAPVNLPKGTTTGTTTGTTPPAVIPPKVIGATNMIGDLTQNADGTFSIKDITFTNLSTGNKVEITQGTGAKIQYHNNNGTLSANFTDGLVFMVESNPLVNAAGTVKDSDTSAMTDANKKIGVGYYEISGLDATLWGANRALVIPVEAPASKFSSYMVVSSGILSTDVGSVTSDQLMGITTPETVALAYFK